MNGYLQAEHLGVGQFFGTPWQYPHILVIYKAIFTGELVPCSIPWEISVYNSLHNKSIQITSTMMFSYDLQEL